MTVHQNLMKKEKELGLFDRLSEIIRDHHSFLITTHLVPDGDGLGGEIALAEYLRELGKECQIINSDPTPDKFALVDPDQEIKIWQGGALPKVEIIFGIDVNEENRLGKLQEVLSKARLVYIDHHILEGPHRDRHIIDDQISSMGEFFYRFFKYMNAEINFKMALAMYVSIVTDTQQFRHRRTTPLSHAIAASLVEIGVDPERVHQSVHQNRTLDEVLLLGEALKRIQVSPDRKIAWIELTRDLQQKYKASPEESQGFADHLLRLKGIEIGVLFREEGPGEIKVSFRSRGTIEIYPLAKKLGGGGHKFEAGVLMKGDMVSVRSKVLEAIGALLSRS